MKENKLETLIWIIFTIVGAILVIFGIIIFGFIFNYRNKIDTVGTITEISDDVYVTYIAKGKEYTSKLNGYSSNFYEGKKIDIYYDKDNPNQIGMKSLNLLFLIFPGIGLIFLTIGGIGIFVKIKRRKLEKNLKENGQLIYADYVETMVNTSYSINGRHPYYIICEWNHPFDDKNYIFKSKNIWVNPKNMIEKRNIKQFPVYINKDCLKKYVVDTDILTENIVDLR